ncbi:MAG: precorrin-4 C(11)-methyltransferase [Cyanobacteria bacterium J083]|nr:MAG: precorrin-4 C(11)-methyltransferase [Cyanobacteria bacterium J083]
MSDNLAKKVYLVGAGPGDPELLTVKAAKIIQQADVIFYADSLVPKQILAETKPTVELIRTGSKILEEIVPLMIKRVKAGKSVVRLHSGDLTLYSAITEQIELLTEAGVEIELIPGISAYQAAAARLAKELTVPEIVQTIILTRISGQASAVPATEELASLAAHKSSLCLYLAARHVKAAENKLLQHYPPDTPVAICFRVGWQDEKIWVVPLAMMAKTSLQENLVRTTLYIISPALNKLNNKRSRLYHPTHSHLFRR